MLQESSIVFDGQVRNKNGAADGESNLKLQKPALVI